MIKEKGVIVHPGELTDAWTDLILNSDINLLGFHPVGGENSHVRVMELAQNGLSEKENALLNKLMNKNTGIEYELHVMSALLPRDLFVKHPECFRIDENGNRNPDYNCCASNKDALDIISENAANLAKLLPSSTHRYNFWLDDVKDMVCRCDECKHLNASDQALSVYNAVLRGLKRTDSLAKQSYLGYFGTSDVPNKVTPEEGIFLEFAPFQRDFNSPLTGDNNSRSRNDAKALIDYFGKNDSKVLEYWLDNSMYSGWTKPPKRFALNREVCENDLDFYDKTGYSVITTFACYLGNDYESLYSFPDLDGYIKKGHKK